MYTYMCVCIYVYTYFRAYICVHVFKGTQLSDFGQIFEFSFKKSGHLKSSLFPQGGEDTQDALSLQVIFRKRAL